MEKCFVVDIPEIDCYVKVYKGLLDEDRLKRLYKLSKASCVKRYPITVFGKKTIQPRTNCVFGDIDLLGSYVKYSTAEIELTEWHAEMRELCDDIATPNFSPDMCLVNGYINLTDMVGAHRDKDLQDKYNTVCTVSLGGTRRFIFKPYKPHKLIPENIEIELEHGDVLYMFGNTNEYFTHEIAKYRKTMDKFEFAPRYSLTFREQQGGKAFPESKKK